MAPITVPEPPKMLTPPTTTAATDLQLQPAAGLDRDVAEAREKHEAGEAGERARQHEGGEDDAAASAGRSAAAASGLEPMA